MRPEKEEMVKGVRDEVERSGFVLVTCYRGLKADQIRELRGRLRGLGRFRVVRNRLAKRSADGAGRGRLSELVSGPTALITGDGDGAAASKAVLGFIEENGMPEVRGGMLGDRLLSADDVQRLGRMPALEVMAGRLAGTLAAPMVRLVWALSGKMAGLVQVIKAFERKKAGTG